MRLCEPFSIGRAVAPSRVVFGPIVTNLGTDGRTFSPRHVAFYRRRAAGGVGVVVTEGASVHPLDWPYERAPLAERCADGWTAISAAGHDEGALVVASLDHAGGQGSSAFSQRELWAPSRVPEVNSREVPKWMEADDVAAVVAGFAAAARLAVASGCDGVEVNAGQHSLVRQFLSGLTNQRDDAWGEDRRRFAREVLAAVRAAVGPDPLVGLRLSCDELAPWAGITPEQAPELAVDLSGPIDYLVVVRGSIFSVEQTRPDVHQPTMVGAATCRAVRAAVPDGVVVVLQGSVVHVEEAEAALGDGTCDAVEMTRAQLADADLVARARRGDASRIRPCTRCNERCQVRDARNPIVSCTVDPSTGHEGLDPAWDPPAAPPRRVVVVGGGPAGLEAARVAADRGHVVTLLERRPNTGGLAAVAGPHGPFVAWQAAELARLDVDVRLGVDAERRVGVRADGGVGDDGGVGADGGVGDDGAVVVQCTGGRGGVRPFATEPGATVVDVAELRLGEATLPAEGPIVVFDPIGGPIAVALAEELGARATLVTGDAIAGNELSRTGDLAPANTRLQQAGVVIERRTLLRRVAAGHVDVEDRHTGATRRIDAVAVVDCGFREPTAPLPWAVLRAGDCVAPRTVAEAVLEGRRAALAVDHATVLGSPGGAGSPGRPGRPTTPDGTVPMGTGLG